MHISGVLTGGDISVRPPISTKITAKLYTSVETWCIKEGSANASGGRYTLKNAVLF